MSFNGQSNQWQRSMPFPGGQQVFLQQPFAHFSSGGSYPPPLNPVAFQQPAAESNNQPQHYNSIGTVTKVNSKCGLVNDEVFFYRTCCKGQVPKLGDRVIFDASSSSSEQFKWNATRVQLMPQQSPHPQPLMGSASNSSNSKATFNPVTPLCDYQRTQSQQQRHSPPVRRFSPVRERERYTRERREHNYQSRDRDEVEHDRKRRREDLSRERVVANNNTSRANIWPDRDRERERDRERDNIVKAKTEISSHADRKEREKERDRDREREREKDAARIERVERSPHRAAMKGRKSRTIRRYMVQIPKNVLTFKQADVQELRRRYKTLYIPSDFFQVNAKWSKIFTPDNPFSLHHACQYHIMHKIVEPLVEPKVYDLDPADVDYTYSAKVMLMACPSLGELYQKCFEDDDGDSDVHNTAVHPSRLISFLVGTRGRNEPMAIGGPWSPSLDGGNPDKDPATLIRTAIRTCKALTGIDLSNCTQWYRFMELHYYRNDNSSSKEKSTSTASSAVQAPRIETVVFYLPDIHTCMPTVTDWSSMSLAYKAAVENVIALKTATASATPAVNKPLTSATANVDNNSVDGGDEGDGDYGKECNSAALVKNIDIAADADVGETATRDAASSNDGRVAEDKATAAGGDSVDDSPLAEAADQYQHEKKDDSPNSEPHGDIAPTHYTQLDLKTMKLPAIRDELVARALTTKGERNILLARLAKAINAEKISEKNTNMMEEHTTLSGGEAEEKDTAPLEEPEDWADANDVDMNDIVILDEYDASKNLDTNEEMDEKEKAQLIRRYTLPAAPHVLVHPHKTAKGSKFDCSVMSLSVLLDYRSDDTKERFFEVSLFAELFNEMLMRDFGFNIYKDLYLQSEQGSGNATASEINERESVSANEFVNEKGKATPLKEGPVAMEESATTESKSCAADTTSEKSLRRDPEDDSQSSKSLSDRKRKPPSTISGGGTSKDKTTDAAASGKMIVVKPQLLLSFLYFDTTHCGYIYEKDLEDLFHILDLKLSRGQIRRVLGKLGTRQAFHYRKLTDKEEPADDAAAAVADSFVPASVDELTTIALGNAQYERIFTEDADGEFRDDAMRRTGSEDLVNHNGIMIHVGKLVEQNKRVEKTNWDLEKLYNELSKQHADLQKEHSKSTSKIKDLQSETRSLGRKLADANQEALSLGRKCRDQTATLSSIYGRVAPYFTRDKESRDHKPDNTNRDSDKDKEKNKDKERERDGKEQEKNGKDVAKSEKIKKERHEKVTDENQSSVKVEHSSIGSTASEEAIKQGDNLSQDAEQHNKKQ